jgi:hypothetical protein
MKPKQPAGPEMTLGNMREVGVQAITVFASVAVAALVTAHSPVSGQTVMGAGTISCGEWLRLRSFEGRAGNFKELASLYQIHAWIDGFVSGINLRIDLADTGGPDLLASRPDSVAMYAWLDNYCRSKPLNIVVDAVMALAKELQSRAK